MKILKISLLIAFVIFSGFVRDSQTGKTDTGVVVPMKFWGVILPDDAGGLIPCDPVWAGINHRRFGFLQGHQTHGGELIKEQSTWEIISCSTDLATGLNTSQVVGVNTVSNGDTYTWVCTMLINISALDVILNVTVTAGTGRFEGATGEINMSGTMTGHGIPCYGEGFLSFPKKDQ